MLNWFGLWAAVTAIGLALHLGVRNRSPAIDPIVDALVPIANAAHLVSLPVRSSLGKAGVPAHLPPMLFNVVAVSTGWLLLIAAVAALNELRLRVVSRPAVAVDPSRRRFLINAGFGAGALAGCGAGVKAAVVDPGDTVLRRYTIAVRGLHPSLDGVRIVQISDTHLGPIVSATHVRNAVGLALRARPDMVVLTGDYIHMGTDHIEQAALLFAPLTARGGPTLGVLGVLGNHDFYGDAARMRSALERGGVRMIDNTRVFLDPIARAWRDRASAGALCFAGLGDLDEDATDVRAALADVPEETPRIMLCHQPDTLELPEVRGQRIDLALCGHTHGGQIALPFVGTPIVPSRYGQKYAGGLVRGPAGPVIVSRGVGMSLLPVRWNVPPEVVEITLRASASTAFAG